MHVALAVHIMSGCRSTGRAAGKLRVAARQAEQQEESQTQSGRNAAVWIHILRCRPHPAPGDWGSGDDRRLLRALLASGAAQEWQPDWGALVPGRTAAQVLPGSCDPTLNSWGCASFVPAGAIGWLHVRCSQQLTLLSEEICSGCPGAQCLHSMPSRFAASPWPHVVG